MAQVFTVQFLAQRAVGFQIVPIPEGTAGTVGGSGVTADTVAVGGFTWAISLSTGNGCFFDGGDGPGPSPGPGPIDPPVPIVYGRDNLSVNLLMFRGDTFTFTGSAVNGSDPVDLTGSVLRFTVKRSVRDPDADAVIQLSTITSGVTIITATEGTFRVTIPSADTADLPAHLLNLPYDIQMVDSGGNVFTLIFGILQVQPDVTDTNT